jgi:hypothetical protein
MELWTAIQRTGALTERRWIWALRKMYRTKVKRERRKCIAEIEKIYGMVVDGGNDLWNCGCG